MADVAKAMYLGQPGTGDTLLYTAVAGGAIVRQIHVCNTTTPEHGRRHRGRRALPVGRHDPRLLDV
jgi:DNA replication protein DnaC